MKGTIFENIFRHWDTTLAGVLFAIIELLLVQIQTGKIDWKALAVAALTVLLGALARGLKPSSDIEQK